jgi:DNA (cytosine-5)-methyltransferase 1
VFVVGYLGDWRRAAAVFFEPESLSGNTAPRREAGQRVAPTISARPTGGGGLGTDFDCDGGLIANEVAPTLNAAFGQKLGLENQHIDSGAGMFVASRAVAATLTRGAESHGKGGYAGRRQEDDDNLVAHSLRGEGFDASEDGTGRGTPLIPIDMRQASRGATMTNKRPEGQSGGAPGTGIGEDGDPSPSLGTSHVPAVAFSIMPQNSGKDFKARQVDVAQPLMAGGPVGGNQGGDYLVQPYTLAIRGRDGEPDLEYRQDGTANAVLTPNGGRAGIGVGAVAIQAGALRENPESGPDGVGVQADIAYTLEARAEVQAVQERWAVRRLMPIECERLQGFPDNFTDIMPNGKPTADGPRYKALGNSMAVNVMRWIGQRIELVDRIASEQMREAAE